MLVTGLPLYLMIFSVSLKCIISLGRNVVLFLCAMITIIFSLADCQRILSSKCLFIFLLVFGTSQLCHILNLKMVNCAAFLMMVEFYSHCLTIQVLAFQVCKSGWRCRSACLFLCVIG